MTVPSQWSYYGTILSPKSGPRGGLVEAQCSVAGVGMNVGTTRHHRPVHQRQKPPSCPRWRRAAAGPGLRQAYRRRRPRGPRATLGSELRARGRLRWHCGATVGQALAVGRASSSGPVCLSPIPTQAGSFFGPCRWWPVPSSMRRTNHPGLALCISPAPSPARTNVRAILQADAMTTNCHIGGHG